VKVYWSKCGHGHGNFGDKLTPLLLRHYGIACEWAPVEHAELIGVGSVLEKAPENYRGYICTTGFMNETSRRSFPKARVLAVRGRLTLDRIQYSNAANVALGDAGLLCDEFPTAPHKRYKLGIVPHFADANDPVVKEIAAASREITVVDVCDETLQVIRHVSECERVLSSSLHGLILADSLGIPNRWMELRRGTSRVEGGGFKFRDYYSTFGLEPDPLFLESTARLDDLLASIPAFDRPGIGAVKERLRKTFRNLRESIPPPSGEELRASAEAKAEWGKRLHQFQATIIRCIPEGSAILLADEDQLRNELHGFRATPFIERDGAYWGPPGTEEEAMAEMQRAVQNGVEWVVIAWPMFWLLEHFSGFAEHVSLHFETIEQNEAAVILRVRR
jgi:pyruvyltransferase